MMEAGYTQSEEAAHASDKRDAELPRFGNARGAGSKSTKMVFPRGKRRENDSK